MMIENSGGNVPKQAVLLIHGIGEQKPMDSLRGFVEAVWTTATNLHKDYKGSNIYWSKPYKLTNTFELRRLTTPENKAGIRTDFFELYWAHLMHGNKLRHVFGWLRPLLIRWPWKVPAHLQLVYWVLLSLISVGIFFAYQATMFNEPLLPPWLSGVAGVTVLTVITGILENIVGDAARYLHPAPTNVQRRNEIRAMGVEVLRSLHERNYERIIVVGHSLGSVIGLDVLYHTWIEFNRDTKGAQAPKMDKLNELEQLARDIVDKKDYSADLVQSAQHAYFHELKSNGGRWRVTDFVTLGSPLAHAEVLLAHDRGNLKRKIEDREIATCLPALEASLHKPPKRLFSYPPDKEERIPHHAAVFGPTRWTNLYFPCRFLVWGDLVGGKLKQVLGEGVNDRPVRTGRWLGLLSHTNYWKLHGTNQHVEELRCTLNLLDQDRPGTNVA